MGVTIFDRFWHQTLGRPYGLSKTFDQGEGQPVVLLHGIGRTGQVWDHVVKLLLPLRVRILAYDLLGFGESPKPAWIQYSVDDHARAVIASLEKAHLGQPAILVGHSMGCLVAVRVAKLRPDLVHHLVLYEMPLYEGLPEKRRYRLRTNLYYRLFKQITTYQPAFSFENQRLAEKLARRIVGLEVTPATWLPFIRSLQNTIMKQTTADDIKQIDAPMDVIYGRFDMLVIRGQPRKFFGDRAEGITSHTVRARHAISLKASQFLVARIQAAIHDAEAIAALQHVEEVIRD
jgi:pimeloyl-ACP methyl ester carboxylesterase